MTTLAAAHPVLMFGVIGALVICVVIVRQMWINNRRDELSAWAQQRGYTFIAHRNLDIERVCPFRCFQHGRSRFAYNVATGCTERHPLFALDYHYITGGGRNRRVHRFSAVILETSIPLKRLLIRRENMLDKLAGFVGLEDIDFESAEFSREFYVAADDRKWAYDVLHARAIQYLLRHPHYNIEFFDRHAVIYDNMLLRPEGFDRLITHLEAFLALLPNYIIQQQSGVMA